MGIRLDDLTSPNVLLSGQDKVNYALRLSTMSAKEMNKLAEESLRKMKDLKMADNLVSYWDYQKPGNQERLKKILALNLVSRDLEGEFNGLTFQQMVNSGSHTEIKRLIELGLSEGGYGLIQALNSDIFLLRSMVTGSYTFPENLEYFSSFVGNNIQPTKLIKKSNSLEKEGRLLKKFKSQRASSDRGREVLSIVSQESKKITDYVGQLLKKESLKFCSVLF